MDLLLRILEKQLSVSTNQALLITFITSLAIIMVALVIINYIISATIENLANKLKKKINFSYYHLVIEHPSKIIRKLVAIITLIIPYFIVNDIFGNIDKDHILPINLITKAFIIIQIILLVQITKILTNCLFQELKSSSFFKNKPLGSYEQITTILIYAMGVANIYVVITEKSLGVLLTAIGAISAILILVFKDTILGAVASIQLSNNEMVKIGDWITVKSYGADGYVIEINLNTVKVQNFDKTITTIPTYSMISGSFQNWSAMQEYGNRRIKKRILIDTKSIKFLTREEFNNFKKIPILQELLTNYIEINNQIIDSHLLVDKLNITNVTLFRKYIELYLKSNNNISDKIGSTMMVRQLDSLDNGAYQLEVYCFTKTTIWVEYEHILADILDHVYASSKLFELEIFMLT